MSDLHTLINDRRKALGLKVPQVAEAMDLSPATTFKLLSGERTMSPERALTLRDALSKGDAEWAETFDRLWEMEKTSSRRPSPLLLALDDPESSLRVYSFPFPPFAGDLQKSFMEVVTAKCFSLASMRTDFVYSSKHLPGGEVQFDIAERIAALESREVDISFMLSTLTRARKTRAIELPIRIAVSGALCQRPSAPDLPGGGPSRLQLARRLLTHGEQPGSRPFYVITVAGEVGQNWMENNHHLTVNATPDREPNPPTACLSPQQTLDPKFLAGRMRQLSALTDVMLVANEITSLGVIRALEGSGTLVLSPQSDQSILHSSDRRIPPALYLGLGLLRADTTPLSGFLDELFKSYLSIEPESIAASYHRDCYIPLIEYITDCLAHSNIYLGGVRRTNERLQDPAPPGVDRLVWEKTRRTLLDQNVRAVARHTLTLSRRSLESLPLQMAPWRAILTRVREAISVSEGGDRARMREIILICARMALGRDAFGYEEDPFVLLGDLVPTYEPVPPGAELPSRKELLALPHQTNRWKDFLNLLEEELDLDLSSLRRAPERRFEESGDLGRLISRIQNLMEASRDSQLVVTMRPYDSDKDQDVFGKMCVEYAERRGVPALAEQIPLTFENNYSQSIRIIAFNLGQPVGFLDAVRHETQPPGPSQPDLRRTIQVKHLHVARHMMRAGLSRRLIRCIVEKGNEETLRGIWVDSVSLWDSEPNKFHRTGFTPIAGNRLFFELKTTNYEKKRFPWQQRPELLRGDRSRSLRRPAV